MHLRLLGSAAGGGCPQWNCACRLCQRARLSASGVRARLHASVAVSATGESWYLLNATPDVRFQIESFPSLHPHPGLCPGDLRHSPLRGILLTDAELDHTLGLLVLREGTVLEVHAAGAVLAALAQAFPVQRMIEPYAPFRWIEARPHEAFSLDDGRLRVQVLRLGVKKPRYTAASKIEGDWVVGYRLEDLKTGGAAVYAPAVEQWSDELEAELARADCVLVDGTFWSDDEMIRLGTGERTAREMGHVPISGAGGSAERLRALPPKRKIYIHINNTNPVLDESSAEYRYLTERGIEVGTDGMDVEV